ncbi:MAG: MauE/DoxX family redox-associated membrane protein [Armatimonadota bacterium]
MKLTENSWRHLSSVENLLNPLRVAAWPLVCTCLFVAVTTKLQSYDLFCRFVSASLGLNPAFSRLLGCALIVIELAIPLASLHKAVAPLAYLSATALFCCFTVFHLSRAFAGNYLPCSCFGELLKLSPFAFAMITGMLACASLLSSSGVVVLARSGSEQKLPAVARAFWLCTVLCLIGVEAKYVYRFAKPAPSGQIMKISTSSAALLDDAELLSGSRSRTNAIVMFGDYQCPFCRNAVTDYHSYSGKKPCIFWRELPLESIHPGSRGLALVSQIASARGILPKVAPVMFDAGLVRAVQSDIEKHVLGSSISREEKQSASLKLDLHFKLAKHLKVTGTPAIFVIQGSKVYRASDMISAIKFSQPLRN